MNRRVLLSGFLVLVCVAALWGIWRQQDQLAALRAERQQMQAQLATGAEGSASTGTPDPAGAGSVAPPTLVVTPELLRLRGEVTRLTERRRELAGERAENERLRAQLASRGTNRPAGTPLPSAYVRRSEARMMGYNTPDDTLQSLLWAIQNHDVTNFVQAFTPEIAQKLRAQAGESRASIEDLFTQLEGFVGLRILKREPDAYDNSIFVEMEVVPGDPVKRTTFSPVNGQWKISGGF
jgi:hypothetical protein